MGGFSGTFEIHDSDISNLPTLIDPVDYIFTDPAVRSAYFVP
jgi:hypothetical protein